MGGLFTPTEASVVAVVYSALLGGVIYRSLKLKDFSKVFYDSARFAAISLFCIGTASAFGWLLAYYRIPQALVDVIAGWGSGPMTTGFLIALAFLFVGMFIDAIPAIIVLGTVLMPLAVNVSMHPIHFAIIGIISLAFGLVTPPYGLCLLISCSLGEVKVVDVLKDVAIIPGPDAGSVGGLSLCFQNSCCFFRGGSRRSFCDFVFVAGSNDIHQFGRMNILKAS